MNIATQLNDYSGTNPEGLGAERAAPPRTPSVRPATDNVTTVVYPTPRMHVRWAINVGERHYVLRSTFVLQLEELDEGGFVASHATLPVTGWGEDPNRAIDELCEAFDIQYRDLVDAPLSDLSPGALVQRAAFQEIVVDVQVRPLGK